MYMKKLVGILLAVLAVGGTALAAGAIVEKELDYEKGKLVYEVEAEQDGYEYEYEVDATTGEVLEKEKERDDDANKAASAVVTEAKPEVKAETATEDIGKEKAKEIALQHAGVAETEATRLRVEHDYDDGRLEYQIEFRVGNKEYEYEVDAKTGNIHERDFDVEDDRWDD